MKLKGSNLTVGSKVIENHLVMTITVNKLIRMDWLSKSDPLVCVMVEDLETAKFTPYARTELVINEHDCTFKRKIVLPLPPKDDRQRRLMFVVYDDELHRGEVEDVDPSNNEIFMSNRLAKDHKVMVFKRQISDGIVRDHSWLAIGVATIHEISSVERLVSLLVAEFTLLVIGALFFGGSTSTPSLIIDIVVTIWESIFVMPSYWLSSKMFKQTGPEDRTSLFIDLDSAERFAMCALNDVKRLMANLHWKGELPSYFVETRQDALERLKVKARNVGPAEVSSMISQSETSLSRPK